MKVYFVRHGRTSWNKEGRMQGRVDIPLAPEGYEDAKKTRDILKDVNFDYIIVSPLTRAKQTAEVINEFHNAPMFIEQSLIEREFGCLEGKPKDSFNFKDLFSIKDPIIYEGAEPIEHFYNRVQSFINTLKGKDGTVLIVAHGGVAVPIKFLVEKDINEDVATNTLIPSNGEVYEFII